MNTNTELVQELFLLRLIGISFDYIKPFVSDEDSDPLGIIYRKPSYS